MELAQGGKKNREDASGAASPNPCYRCGEDGHFSRECPSSTKVDKKNPIHQPVLLRKSYEESMFSLMHLLIFPVNM